MADENALLAAIWGNPHDDLSRLVYADWLTEHEQSERAEFIRVQCALAKLEPWEDHPQCVAWQRREAELWGAAAKKFRRELTPQLRKDRFRRGFVEPHRGAFAKKFLKLTDSQLAEAPLWGYGLTPGAVALDVLLGFRGMRRVGWFALNDSGSRSDGAERFAQSENLGNLAAFEWQYSFLGADGIRSLGMASNVPNLSQLNINYGDIGESGAAHFGESRLAEQLTTLSIRSNELTPAGAEGLFAPGKFRRLAFLVLGSEEGGDGIIAALATGDRLPALRHLRLDRLKLTPAGAESLAAWPGAASLRHLEVLWHDGGVDVVRQLVRSPHLRNLLALDLTDYTPYHDATVELLRERFGTVGPDPNDTKHTIRGGRLPGDPLVAQSEPLSWPTDLNKNETP